MIDWPFAFSFFATLFSVLNPVHAVPLYLAMVPDPTPQQTQRVASVASITVLITLLLGFLCGKEVLAFFAITTPAFQAGGGILILLMGLSMLQAQTSGVKHVPEETDEALMKSSIAVVPLGIPILAGAGSLSAVIVFTHQAHTWERKVSLVGVIVACTLLTYVLLRTATRLNELLGKTGINIITRLMGLILVAMAVQFMADGIHGLFPALGN